jgi:hypothetical protein
MAKEVLKRGHLPMAAVDQGLSLAWRRPWRSSADSGNWSWVALQQGQGHCGAVLWGWFTWCMWRLYLLPGVCWLVGVEDAVHEGGGACRAS